MDINIRMQIACLFILGYIGYFYMRTKRLKTISSRIFNWVVIVAITNVCFDAISMILVNNRDSFPDVIIHLSHMLFIFSLDLFVYCVYTYIVDLTNTSKHINPVVKRIQKLPVLISAIVVLFGKMHYADIKTGSYAYGLPADTVYISVAIYAALIFHHCYHYKKRGKSKEKTTAIIQATVIMCVITAHQFVMPTSMISALGVTLILLSVYMSMENPGDYIEKQGGMFNRYGFSRIISEEFQMNHRFTVVTIVLDDWKEKSVQESRPFLLQAIGNFVLGELRVDIYHVMDNCLCAIFVENKGLGRFLDTVKERFARGFDINGEKVAVPIHIFRTLCPDEVPSEERVLAAVNGFSNAQTNQMAYQDSLTGTRNRNAFTIESENFFREKSAEHDIGCIMIDVNGLKIINDSRGHSAGDALLKKTAGILCEAVSEEMSVYRIGGDEFVILIEDMDEQQVEELLKRMEIVRQQWNKIDDITVSFAVGHTKYDAEKDVEFSDILRRADELMYENKRIMKAIKSKNVN